MNDKIKYDGELHLWRNEPSEAYGSFVHGSIFNDRKCRFDNGTPIRTSPVVSIEGETLRTRNSVYRLVPREETIRMITAGIDVHRPCAAAKVPG